MLKAHGRCLFDWAVLSFKKYFGEELFVFILRDESGSYDFVHNRVSELGIVNYKIISLKKATDGQAETVAEGVSKVTYDNNDSMLVFNIDTFRLGYNYPEQIRDWDGYLEVFIGTGGNWSFAKPKNKFSTLVAETAEKKPISNLCSTGLYYFSTINDFFNAYEDSLAFNLSEISVGERYIAPLYNFLIKRGLKIHYHIISDEDVVFCGVPDEYETFKGVQNKKFKI